MKRSQFSAEFKKRIAIEAIKEQLTINDIAHEHQIHPVLVSTWKKELLDGASSIFEDPRKRKDDVKKHEQQEGIFQQKIGQLIENDWLKKNLVFNYF